MNLPGLTRIDRSRRGVVSPARYAGVPTAVFSLPRILFGVGGGSVHEVIVVTAALKGGVGKTTTSIYLAALATANRNAVTLIDADPQASAAEWVEAANDQEERFHLWRRVLAAARSV